MYKRQIYPSITYTVADVAAQTDLVAAKATDATKASNASGVSLKFGHILTQINFTVKAADALTYKLKTLTISGVHNKGTYGFDDSTWKSQEGTATYAHTIAGSALEVNTTGVEMNAAWMLMPQTLDTNAKINVVYDIYEKDVLLDTVTSVSYTHLDVYKRQCLRSVSRHRQKRTRYIPCLLRSACTSGGKQGR